MSRDEQAMLVVRYEIFLKKSNIIHFLINSNFGVFSYKDLKRCVELSFADLQKAKKTPNFQQPQ